jgi:hypothetical protein
MNNYKLLFLEFYLGIPLFRLNQKDYNQISLIRRNVLVYHYSSRRNMLQCRALLGHTVFSGCELNEHVLASEFLIIQRTNF